MSQAGFFFYTGDFLKDASKVSLECQGAWIRLLCAMRESETRGELVWPLSSYAAYLGTTVERADRIILTLLQSGVASGEYLDTDLPDCRIDKCVNLHDWNPDLLHQQNLTCQEKNLTVRNCQINVRLVNRRMVREQGTTEKNRAYKQEERARKRASQENVRGKSRRSSSSSSYSSLKKEEEINKEEERSNGEFLPEYWKNRLKDQLKPVPKTGSLKEILDRDFKKP